MFSLNTVLKNLMNKIQSLNSTKLSMEQLHALYGTVTPLTAKCTSIETTWDAITPEISANLIGGNKLDIYIHVKRDSNYSAGDITNQNVGTFEINTLGAIGNAYPFNFTSEVYGQMVSAQLVSTSLPGSGASQKYIFNLQINSTHAAGAELSFRFLVPVRPNPSYYGLT